MVTEERLNTLLAHANPVADVSKIDLIEVGATTYLATLEQRSSEVTQLDTREKDQKAEKTVRQRWLVAAVVIILAGIALVLVNQGDETPVADQPGPDEILTEYADTRNSGDVDGVMAFYAEDAIVENHPLDDDGVATGIDEIRALEEQIPAVQGSGDGQEVIDMVVSGNTVTFNTRFFYGADGTRNSSGEAGCAGGRGHRVTVEDGKITLFVGGPESPTLCPG